jgi:hypothetical protein
MPIATASVHACTTKAASSTGTSGAAVWNSGADISISMGRMKSEIPTASVIWIRFSWRKLRA